MLKSKEIVINGKDCTKFSSSDSEKLFLSHYCEKFRQPAIFQLSSFYNKPAEPIIYFNYEDKEWWSGRYIGNVNFTIDNKDVAIKIAPRFGNEILLKMFSELFNISFVNSLTSVNYSDDSYYLKILIAFIWLQKLANCNRHGLPKIKTVKRHCSFSIKGKLLAAQSMIIHQTVGKVISENREKVFDNLIIKILYHAYCILKNDYKLGELQIPKNAQDSINSIDENISDFSAFTQYEYDSIKYHPIYQNYKDVVDFSWLIIKAKYGLNEDKNDLKINGFFLDMAEIWECYIRNMLIKTFLPYGWQLCRSEYEVYENSFFKRNIIPDIVLKKDNNYIVFDAKYKEMKYRKEDLDRNDFFQIHTYISYLQTKGNVVLGGLLYPVTAQNENNVTTQTFFRLWEGGNTFFMVDGPVVNANCIEMSQIDSIIKKIINM